MFFTFQIVVILILTGIQYYFYRKLFLYIQKRRTVRWMKIATYCVFLLFNIPMYTFVFLHLSVTRLPQWMVFTCVYPLYIWHFSFFILFLLTAVWKALTFSSLGVRWLLRRWKPAEQWMQSVTSAPKYREFDSRRRLFLQRGVAVVAGATITGSVYGAFHHDEHETTEISVPIKDLPDQFTGFSIALISDIHSSVFMMREKMERYAGSVNALRSDLVVVVGDFVNSMVEEVYPFAEAFSRLSAPYGVYGVLGNHDYYTQNVEVVAKEVNECGIKLLRNEHIVLTKGKHTLYLLGVDDVGSRRGAKQLIDRSLDGVNGNAPKVLMCHRPYFFEQAASQKINLTLSGHTHGFQMGIEIPGFKWSPVQYVYKQWAGYYAENNQHLYVNRGFGFIGYAGRVGIKPEVTVIELVRG